MDNTKLMTILIVTVVMMVVIYDSVAAFKSPAIRRQLYGIPGSNCSFCPSGSNCSDVSHAFCENEAPYCYVEVTKDASGQAQISRGCAKETDCYHRWWKWTFKSQSHCPTFGDSEAPLAAYPFNTSCYYCCQSFGLSVPCNSALAPSSPIAYTPMHFMTPPPDIGR